MLIADKYNFQELQELYVLELYYTDWCHWSNEFYPEWTKIKEYICDNTITIKCKEYNYANENDKKITDDRKIEGFPTIRLCKFDETYVFYSDYHKRDYDNIIKFIELNTQ